MIRTLIGLVFLFTMIAIIGGVMQFSEEQRPYVIGVFVAVCVAIWLFLPEKRARD